MANSLGIPQHPIIGYQNTWFTSLDGVNPASYSLLWEFSPAISQSITTSVELTRWVTVADFSGASIQPYTATLSTVAPDNTKTLIATLTITPRTQQLQHLYDRLEAVQASLLKLSASGMQTLSIKGRSRSAFGLDQLQQQESYLLAQIRRIENPGSNYSYIRFAAPQ